MNDGSKRYGVYQPGRRRNTESGPGPYRRARSRLLFVVFGLLSIVALGSYISYEHRATARQAEKSAWAVSSERQKAFRMTVEKLVAKNQKLDISVAAIDLQTGRLQTVGKQSPVTAASTTKLLAACLYLHKTERNERGVSEKIAGRGANEAIRQLVNRSDNDIWMELIDKLGRATLTNYAEAIGIDDYDAYKNQISSRSLARFMEKLYKGELLNKKNTDQILAYMQRTNYENFIPPAVPSSLRLHHKVGLVDDQINDAAVISDGKKSFVLVIFTNGNGSYDWEHRAELMQEITRSAVSAYL